MLGVEGHNAAAGSTRGGVNTHTLGKRLGKQAIGIGITKIGLREEGELMKILDAVDILGLNTRLIHQIAVVRDVLIHVLDLLDKLFGLELFTLLCRHGFKFLLIVLLCHFCLFLSFLFGACSVQRTNKNALCIPKGYRGRELIIPWYHLSLPPPRGSGLIRYKQYRCPVTGTPVASYLSRSLFSALLTEGIREGLPHCLAPTGNSLKVLSNLLVSALSHLLAV